MNRRHFLATLPALPLAAPNTRTPPPTKPSDGPPPLLRWNFSTRQWQPVEGMNHDVGAVYWCPAWDCLAIWTRPDGGLEYVDFPEGTVAP